MYQIYGDTSEGGAAKSTEGTDPKVKDEPGAQEASSIKVEGDTNSTADVGGGGALLVDQKTGEQLMASEVGVATGGNESGEVEGNKLEDGEMMEGLEQGKSLDKGEEVEPVKQEVVVEEGQKEEEPLHQGLELTEEMGPSTAVQGVVEEGQPSGVGGAGAGGVQVGGAEEEQEAMEEDDTPGFVLSEGDVKRIVNILEELKNALEHSKHTTVSAVQCSTHAIASA